MITWTKMTIEDRNQLSYIAMDGVLWACRNAYDLERIADHFTSGDLSDAFKLCLKNGMDNMISQCDLDDKATEAGL